MISIVKNVLLIVLVIGYSWSVANIAHAQVVKKAPAKQQDSWFNKQSVWHGFDQFHFKLGNRNAYVVVPVKALPGNPWIWRARFPNFHAQADVQMLGAGYHIAYVDVAGMFGGPKAMEIADKFYSYMTKQRGMAKRPIMEGVSRGGLFVYNWAAKNTDKVAAIYCDTPVCDFKSWPGGKGKGIGHAQSWKQCLAMYKLDEKSASGFNGNPIDQLDSIAKAKIPIMHIVSENDRVVPPNENTRIIEKRLKQLGHSMEVISVTEGTESSKGHHFKHPDPKRVAEFMQKHTKR